MKLQLPTIIIVCLSIILILAIHFLGGKDTQTVLESNEESNEFRSIRIDAENAHAANNFSQAIQLYEEALELRPENAEICNDLGAVHYNYALKNAGPDWPSWKDISSDGSVKEALTDLNVALQNVESGYFRIQTSSNDIAQAIQDEAQVKGASVFPYHGNTETTLNILIGPTKDHILQAYTYYLMAIELKSTYAAPYRNLGSLYMKIGIRDKARNYLQEAFKREPSDEELAEYLYQLKSGY